MPDSRPIGIFDSGVGGLTVFAAVQKHLPHESIVYLGDTARVPYGTKSHDTVERYARSCARVLLERDIKLLVVACNTASAHALEALERDLPIPVIGVIAPGARALIGKSRTGRVGVIGTAGTIASGAYQRAIHALSPKAEVNVKACPLFVPLAEEGWTEGEVPEAVARTYLEDLVRDDIDAMVLGCTHYPLLAATIAQVAGPAIALVDSAEETAAAVAHTVQRLHLSATDASEASYRFLVTDAPDIFQQVGSRFLGQPLHDVEWVDF